MNVTSVLYIFHQDQFSPKTLVADTRKHFLVRHMSEGQTTFNVGFRDRNTAKKISLKSSYGNGEKIWLDPWHLKRGWHFVPAPISQPVLALPSCPFLLAKIAHQNAVYNEKHSLTKHTVCEHKSNYGLETWYDQIKTISSLACFRSVYRLIAY